VNPVVNQIRSAFDRMFWRQYADEIHLHPEAPAMCCLLGMSQVSIVIFLFAMGLLAPVVHLLRYVLRRSGVTDPLASGFDLRWFVAMCCVAAFIAVFISFRLYWQYRLAPDRAAARDPNAERDEATVTAVKLTMAALIFMATMEIVFK
jgi:hypothetical protein